MIVVLDEGLDVSFEVTGQVIVFQQDPVLQGLMPALDLALGLGMVTSRALCLLKTASALETVAFRTGTG